MNQTIHMQEKTGWGVHPGFFRKPKLKQGVNESRVHLDTAAGARTFLSAARCDHHTISMRFQAVFHSNAAADRNVRAPALAVVSRCARERHFVGFLLLV